MTMKSHTNSISIPLFTPYSHHFLFSSIIDTLPCTYCLYISVLFNLLILIIEYIVYPTLLYNVFMIVIV